MLNDMMRGVLSMPRVVSRAEPWRGVFLEGARQGERMDREGDSSRGRALQNGRRLLQRWSAALISTLFFRAQSVQPLSEERGNCTRAVLHIIQLVPTILPHVVSRTRCGSASDGLGVISPAGAHCRVSSSCILGYPFLVILSVSRAHCAATLSFFLPF